MVETIERELHRLFRFFNGKATHRARSVEHEDKLLRHYVFSRYSLRWLQNQCEESTLAGTMGEQCIFNFFAGYIVTKDEILVGNLRAVLQTDVSATVVGAFDFDFVS